MRKYKKINRYEQPPKISSSIVPDTGAMVSQTYNVLTGEYYPNRALIPLVLTPVVSYTEADSSNRVENASPMLINGRWFRFDNGSDGTFTAANMISNDGTKFIIDTTLGSSTYGKLTIKENTEPENPVTYVFLATLSKGDGYAVSCSFRTQCEKISIRPRLSFDNAIRGLYDPIDPNSFPSFKINPVVHPDGLTATFAWKYQLNGNWIDFEASPETYAVTKSGNGVVINRSIMPEEIALKCIATIIVEGNAVTLEEVITHTRLISAFEFDISNIAELSYGTTRINPKAIIRSGRNLITNYVEELSVNWYGSSNVPIATGLNPSIEVSSLGADMNLGLDVVDNGGYKVLIDDDGTYLTDDDGTYLICK